MGQHGVNKVGSGHITSMLMLQHPFTLDSYIICTMVLHEAHVLQYGLIRLLAYMSTAVDTWLHARVQPDLITSLHDLQLM